MGVNFFTHLLETDVEYNSETGSPKQEFQKLGSTKQGSDLETDEEYYPELRSDGQRSPKMRSPKQGSKSEKGEEFYAQKRSLKQTLDSEIDQGSIMKKSIKENYSPMECSVNLSYVESMNESSKYFSFNIKKSKKKYECHESCDFSTNFAMGKVIFQL